MNHAGLLVGSEEQDAETLMFEGEGSEDFAGDAEVGLTEMGALGGFGERESDTAEGFGGHGWIWLQDDTSGGGKYHNLKFEFEIGNLKFQMEARATAGLASLCSWYALRAGIFAGPKGP